MKNILVTGGAGYIGSHTCKALSLAGYNPIVYDNLVTGHELAVKWGPLEIGDISDQDRLYAVLRTYQPIAVIHFAAFAYVGESVARPLKYYRNNVCGTLSLLEAMREHGITNIVFSSTCATYGEPQQIPITESHPQLPVNPYGMSKLMVEEILCDCGNAYGLNSICLRYFNAAGADPDGEIGEDHDPETHLIPLVLKAAAGELPYVTIFGDDYDTDDGTCLRDYIHVRDLADAHVLALTNLPGEGGSIAFNLGNGAGFSVMEVIDSAERISGRKISTEIGPRRKGDVAVLISNATKFTEEFHWTPNFKRLDEIIETAWQWMQK